MRRSALIVILKAHKRGSVVSRLQSFELRAYLVGQIARALTVFGVDEVVIYEDSGNSYSCYIDFLM